MIDGRYQTLAQAPLETEVVTNSLEMLSGCGKIEHAKEAQAAEDAATVTNGAAEEPLEAVVAM